MIVSIIVIMSVLMIMMFFSHHQNGYQQANEHVSGVPKSWYPQVNDFMYNPMLKMDDFTVWENSILILMMIFISCLESYPAGDIILISVRVRWLS